MKSKTLFSLLFLLTAGAISMAHAEDLLTWNTFGNSGTETSEASATHLIGLSPAMLTLGPGLDSAANGNRFGADGWFDEGDASPTTLADAIASGEYIEFTLTPLDGFSVSVSAFSFIWQSSSTGPSELVLRSSADAYGSDLGFLSNMNADKTETLLNPEVAGNFSTISISGLTDIVSPLTFRFYGYGATRTNGSGGFDTKAATAPNVRLIGSAVTAVPEPRATSLALAGLLGLAIGLRRRKSVRAA